MHVPLYKHANIYSNNRFYISRIIINEIHSCERDIYLPCITEIYNDIRILSIPIRSRYIPYTYTYTYNFVFLFCRKPIRGGSHAGRPGAFLPLRAQLQTGSRHQPNGRHRFQGRSRFHFECRGRIKVFLIAIDF